MPQEFIVVRCYSCQTFQIHQTRKDNKFSCKICGLKQSRKKVYCEGNPKDCRIAVQQLNSRIENEEEILLEELLHKNEDLDNDNTQEPKSRLEFEDIFKPKSSKWSTFIETADEYPAGASDDSNFYGSNEWLSVGNHNSDNPDTDTKSSTMAYGAFTSVKRFHNSIPKQILAKNQDTLISDFTFQEKTSFKPILSEMGNKDQDIISDVDANTYPQSNYKNINRCKTKLHGTDTTSSEFHIKHKQVPEGARNSQKLFDDDGSLSNENAYMKKKAFQKFRDLDDDIFDTLNKSFYS